MASFLAHFDAIATEYESNRLGPWYIAHGEFIVGRLGGKTFRTVLDIGCGTGWLLRSLVDRGIAERGIGLDASSGMIDEARLRVPDTAMERLSFRQGVWPELSPGVADWVAAEPVDLIICASSAHYFPDLEEALVRCHETVEPGGFILVLERAPEMSILTRMWGRAHVSILQDGIRFLDTDAFHEVLRGVGFVDVGVQAVLQRMFWKGKLVTSMALSVGRKPDTTDTFSNKEAVNS